MLTITAIGEFHESGRESSTALHLVGVLDPRRLRQLPARVPHRLEEGSCRMAERFLHFSEPAGSSYFPAVGHATPSWWLAIVASLVAVAGAGWVHLLFVKVDRLAKRTGEHLVGFPTGSPPRMRLLAGHKLLVNKYYLDHLYTGIIAGSTKGPIAKAATG